MDFKKITYSNYINRINQSSSVYMPTDIRHLLPEIYSEDICSLLKGRIRKTVMVLFMDMTLFLSIMKNQVLYQHLRVYL